MVDTVAKSIGHHGHWGLSSGFDFLAVLSKPGTENDRLLEARDPINILLIQPGDIRHIILTISRRRRHYMGSLMDTRPIHFYLFEPVMEVLARELTLLQVLNDYQVPIRQRANTYLEIYGNLKVQKRTCEYIEQQGRDLKLLSSRGRGKLDHVLRFDQLNYRDRDQFERALDCYSTSATFDIDRLLDHRQRGCVYTISRPFTKVKIDVVIILKQSVCRSLRCTQSPVRLGLPCQHQVQGEHSPLEDLQELATHGHRLRVR